MEFRTAFAARGGLLFMKNVPGVALADRVMVRDHRGQKRNGLVIRCSKEVVLVEVFEGTDNLDLERTWVRFLDEPFELALSREILGRVFNGVGQPRDGRPPIVSMLRRPVNGSPVNPSARAYPREFIRPASPPSTASILLCAARSSPSFLALDCHRTVWRRRSCGRQDCRAKKAISRWFLRRWASAMPMLDSSRRTWRQVVY